MRDSIVKANLAHIFQAEKPHDKAAHLYRAATNEFSALPGRGPAPWLDHGKLCFSAAGHRRLRTGGKAAALRARVGLPGVLARDGH